ALAAQLDAGAVLDAGGDAHGDGALGGGAAVPGAGGAGALDHVAVAVAGGARRHRDHLAQQRLGDALHVAGAGAGGAAGGAGAGLAAGAGAALAQHGRPEGDLLRGAEDHVAQLDPHTTQHVTAAALARHRALAAAAHAGGAGEHVEDVVEVEAGPTAGEAAHPGAAAHVVLAALVRVGQRLVGLRDPLELLGGVRVRVHVRMEGAGEFAVRLLDLVGRGLAGDAEQVVVVLVHRDGFLRGGRGVGAGAGGGATRAVERCGAGREVPRRSYSR